MTRSGLLGRWVDRLLRAQTWRRAQRRERRTILRLAHADAVVVSFPKSGRTWLRALLSRLCQIATGMPEAMLFEFDNFHLRDPAIPRILFTHDVDAMVPAARMPADKSRYCGRPVALLARHPADVVVSRYFHLKHRSSDPARRRLAKLPLEDFVWTQFGGIPAIVAFLNHWAAAARAHPEIRIVRYEDFLNQPEETLLALARHLGVPASAAAVREAVEFAAFDNLKKKEAEGFFTNKRLQPSRHGGEEAVQGSFKVRSGKAGGWCERFTAPQCERIRAFIRAELDPVFGYERDDR